MTEPAHSPATTPGRAARPAARGHTATGGRILALGLSTGAALVFTATMANAARDGGGSTAGDPAPTPAPIVVHVVLPDGRTTDSSVVAAPVVTAAPATARAVARSRAS